MKRKDKKAPPYLNLRVLMLQNGYEQDFMAKKLGVGIATFNRKINGRTPWKLDECKIIAGVFNKQINEVF